MKSLVKTSLLLISLFVSNTYAEDLLTIYQQAVEADPTLKNALVKTYIGNDLQKQSFGQMLPQINAAGNWSKNEQSVNGANSQYNGTRYFISLNQPILDFTKFWDWKRSVQVENQYAAEATSATQQLLFNVTERYFKVLGAQDEVTFAQSEQQSFKTQLNQIEKKYAKQLIKVTDLYAAQARLDQLGAEIIIAETRLNTAKESLFELTGNSNSQLPPLSENMEFKPLEGDIQEWINMAKLQNPAISAKQMAITAAQNNIKAQQSKHLPVIDLQLNYYDTNTGFQSANLGTDIKTNVAAINVNIPLFSGGTVSAQVNEAQHKLEISQNDIELTTRAISKETSEAFHTANATVRQIQSLETALLSAEKSRESMERGHQLSVVTISDVIKAQQETLSTRKELAQAKYNYIIQRTRFLRAIGSINLDNLIEINRWLSTNMSTN